MNIQQTEIDKSLTDNSVIMKFKVEPLGTSIIQNLNWNAILSINNIDGSVTNIIYDPLTGDLSLNIQYNSNINSQ